jgi:hypothetical protein
MEYTIRRRLGEWLQKKQELEQCLLSDKTTRVECLILQELLINCIKMIEKYEVQLARLDRRFKVKTN